jgi:hypothetical protein
VPQAIRLSTTIRPATRVTLLAAAAMALCIPAAHAWDYGTPTPPSDPPTSITNAPTGGKGGSAHATASATAAPATATGGMATATSSPSQRVVVRVTPTVSPAPATAAAPTRSATAGDPSGSRRSAGAGDPSGAGDPAGDGRHGGRGGGVAAPPGFALPSFDAGQCSTVGFGIAISPSGGGAFGPAWESTNCRACYSALALWSMGYQQQAIALMRKVFPDVDAVFAQAVTPAQAAQPAQPTPAIDCNAVNRAQTGHGKDVAI